jgi:gas vesicle protein
MPKEYETRDVAQNKNKGSSNSFLLGALVGGIAGALAALLLTPKSGKEMRRTLNTQAGSLMEKTAQLGEKSSNMVSGLVLNKGKKKIEARSAESEVTYIPIGVAETPEHHSIPLNPDEIRRKIAEAEKALEEEENKVKL